MPKRVERTDPEGVDFGWVMQATFVLTVTFGSVFVALLSAFVRLPTWGARAGFAIRVGAVIWILTALGAYYYERSYRLPRRSHEREDSGREVEAEEGDDREDD